MTPRVCSFAPVVAVGARVLILGSMPGRASLAAQRYYAHPHNQFWPIMGALCAAGPELPYERRLARLEICGIALWDVFESCARAGSLDSDIDQRTAVANDIPALLERYPTIERICCNGTAAYTALRRHWGGRLERPGLTIERLPSTSPANALWSRERKLAAWRAALSTCHPGTPASPTVDVTSP